MYSTIKVHAASTMCNRQARMSASQAHTPAGRISSKQPRPVPTFLLNRRFQIHKRPRFPDVMFLLIKENVCRTEWWELRNCCFYTSSKFNWSLNKVCDEWVRLGIIQQNCTSISPMLLSPVDQRMERERLWKAAFDLIGFHSWYRLIMDLPFPMVAFKFSGY